MQRGFLIASTLLTSALPAAAAHTALSTSLKRFESSATQD